MLQQGRIARFPLIVSPGPEVDSHQRADLLRADPGEPATPPSCPQGEGLAFLTTKSEPTAV